MAQDYQEKYSPVRTVLISQPKPQRSPYFELEEKYGLQIDWRPFIHVEPVTEKEFRKERVRPNEYEAIIFTSRTAIDHFFRLCEEMRVEMPKDTRYFCLSESTAVYLQNFIEYRKRKVFYGQRTIQDLKSQLVKHRNKAKFLLPTSNLGSQNVVDFLEQLKIDYDKVVTHRSVSSDLSDLSDVTYDILVFFSPLGIESLYENFPDFKQNETRLAVWGSRTLKAVTDKGLYANIQAPTPDTPSMTMAIKKYLGKVG